MDSWNGIDVFGRMILCSGDIREPIAFVVRRVFLGRDFTQKVDYSEQTAIQIDTEVRRILLEAYERAKLFLRRNLEVLHKMAETLLERESIDGGEIDEIMRQFGNENGGLRGAAAATA